MGNSRMMLDNFTYTIWYYRIALQYIFPNCHSLEEGDSYSLLWSLTVLGEGDCHSLPWSSTVLGECNHALLASLVIDSLWRERLLLASLVINSS